MGRRHRGRKKVFKFTPVPVAAGGSRGDQQVQPSTSTSSTEAEAATVHSEEPEIAQPQAHAHQGCCAEHRAHHAAHHSQGQGHEHGHASSAQSHNSNSSDSDSIGDTDDDDDSGDGDDNSGGGGGIDNEGMDICDSDSDTGADSNVVIYGSDSSGESETVSETLKSIFGNRKKYCSARRGPDGELELVGMDWKEGRKGFKCDLPMGRHGMLECQDDQLCDLCYVSCIRNLGQPVKSGGISFKIPGLTEFPAPPEDQEGEYELTYRIEQPKPRAGQIHTTVTFVMSSDPVGDLEEDEDEADDEEESESGDDEKDDQSESGEEGDDGESDCSGDEETKCGENGEYCDAHRPTACAAKDCPLQSSGGRGAKLLRGMKDWRPAQLSCHGKMTDLLLGHTRS